jgi:hypothetical protein
MAYLLVAEYALAALRMAGATASISFCMLLISLPCLEQPLSTINDILKRLEHGDVPARVVRDFQRAETKSHSQSPSFELAEART